MKSLLAHLKFLPHGNRLLTSSAAFWFFSARVLVFAMAVAETVAWSYLGYLFGEGRSRWIGAAFAGVIIFLVVWMIDVSLITMDRAWREHALQILGQTGPSIRSRRLRELFTFGIRIGLLAASLYITAPYLAQVVFYQDIQRFVDSEATAAVDASRKQIESAFDADLLKKNQEIGDRRTALEREVAGQGLSGRHGIGPTAKTLLANLEKLEGERNEILQKRESALAAYDGLAKDWRTNREALAARYNVNLPQTSILENRKALEELRKRPENRSTEWAIRAFLAFIFGGLLLLKLFEPSSVQLYLSDVLQQEYDRYLAGTFDAMLPATEHSTIRPPSMSPQRLHDFLVNEWRPARLSARDEKDSQARALTLTQLESIKLQTERELEAATTSWQAARTNADQAKRDLDELNSAIEIVREDIKLFENKLAAHAHETGLNDDPSLDHLDDESRLEFDRRRLQTETRRLSLITGQRKKLGDANLALSNLIAKHSTLEEDVRRTNADLQYIERRLREKQNDLSQIELRIREVRREVGSSRTVQI